MDNETTQDDQHGDKLEDSFEDIDDVLHRLDLSTRYANHQDDNNQNNHDHNVQSYSTTPQTSDLDDVLEHLGLGSGDQPLPLGSLLSDNIQLNVICNVAPARQKRPLPTSEQMQGFKKALSTQLHRDTISSIVFSADDEICTTSHDATAKIFSLSSERQVRRISDLGDTVVSSCVLLNAQIDSKTLALSSWNNNIYLYSVDYGRVLDTLCGHEDAVSQLALHNTNLLSGSWDSTVKLWKVSHTGISGVPMASFVEHDTEVRCVTFENMQGNLAASGSKDGDVAIYDVRTGQTINTFTNHYDAIRDISFLDSNTVITCSKDNSIKVCTLSGSVVHSFSSIESIHCLATDGYTVLTGGGDTNGLLQLWAINTGKLLRTVVVDDCAPITSMALRDDGTVVTGSKDGLVSVFKSP